MAVLERIPETACRKSRGSPTSKAAIDGPSARSRRSAVSNGRPKTLLGRKTESYLCLPLVAVGRMVGTTKKNGLTRAGLLMEVADNPLMAGTGPIGHEGVRRRGGP